MAVEKVIVQYELDTKQATASINELEREALTAEKNIATGAKKTSDSIVKTQQTAAQKRAQFIKEETQDLNELRKRRKEAYSVREIEAYNKRIAETKKRIDTVSSATGKLEKRSNILSGAIKSVGIAIAAAFTVDRVIAFTKESITLAAQAGTVKRAFEALNTGTLLNEARRAVNGTVSDLKLMQSILKAREFNIGLENIPTFFAFAKQQADKLGLSVEQLTENIIDGIGRKSTLVLDNLGISATELQAEFKETGDFAEAVGNIIEESMDGAGESIDSTKDSLAQFTASLDNFKAAFGKALGPAAQDAVSRTAGSLNILTSELGLVKKLGILFAAILDPTLLEVFAAGVFEVTTEAERFQKIVQAFTTEEQFIQAIADASSQVQVFGTIFGETSEEVKFYRDRLELLTKAFDDFNNKVVKSTTLLDEFGSSTKTDRDRALEAAEALRKLNEELDKLFSDEQRTERENGLKFLKDYREELQKLSEEAKKAAKDIENLDEALKPPPDDNDDRDVRIQGSLDITRDTVSGLVDVWAAYGAIRQSQRLKELDSEQKIAQQRIAIEKDVLDQRLANGEITNEEFLSLRQNQNDQLNELDRKREEEVRKAKRKAAIADKSAALFDIAINGAIAVAKVTAQTGVAAPATIPLILAQTLAAAALVAARPIPEFATGVVDLQGPGTGTSDSIPAMLSKGESVLQAKVTKDYKPEVTALHQGTFPKLIEEKYIIPALAKREQSQRETFAGNIANSLKYNFDDEGIIHALHKNKKVGINNTDELASMIARKIAQQNYMRGI